MRYLQKILDAQEETAIMLETFAYEPNNDETKRKILDEITDIFIKHDINMHDLQDIAPSAWKVSFNEQERRFNTITISFKLDLDLSFDYERKEKHEKRKTKSIE
jgi:glycine cleavage system regulatory protein